MHGRSVANKRSNGSSLRSLVFQHPRHPRSGFPYRMHNLQAVDVFEIPIGTHRNRRIGRSRHWISIPVIAWGVGDRERRGDVRTADAGRPIGNVYAVDVDAEMNAYLEK